MRPDGPAPGDGAALAHWAGRATGQPDGPGPIRRVHWLQQVHGTTVLTAPIPARAGPLGTGPEPGGITAVFAGAGDGLVSDSPADALAILTADCASVALGSVEGVFGAVHAGWRGLVAGVVEGAIAAMRTLGATDVVGALGPCIHPECYEFSDPDLDRVAAVYGDRVRGRTATGRPALDVPGTVTAALAAGGAAETVGVDACTACAAGYYSHRARGDRGRQALVVWSATPTDRR